MSKEQDTNEETIIPVKFKELVEKIENLNIVDLSELVKLLEKKFGVSASAPTMSFQMPVPGTAGSDAAEEAEEKTAFRIELKNAGGQKIQVIKTIKDILAIGLKEAKDFVDAAPKVVKDGIKKEEAEEIKKKLEEAGATAEIK